MKHWTLVLLLLMTVTTVAQDKPHVARWRCADGTITPTSFEFQWHGGAEDVAVADPGCSWVALVTGSGQGWIELTGATSAKGIGFFSIVVKQNRSSADRRGVVRVGDHSIVVIQRKR